jgi:hypothetical protein
MLPVRIAVDDVWIGRPLGPAVLEQVDGELRPVALGRASVQRARVPRVTGAVMPGVVDRHVHLGLIDATALRHTAVVEVHDLGWVPRIARGWKISPPTGGLVRIAGPFLTAVGGYPVDRTWALAAVDDAAAHGHDLIKVVLHTGGPLLDDATLNALVRAARVERLQVGVHAEGRGQARRAFEAGADILVHAPWSESLPDDLLRAMAGSMRWISTFAIHADADRERAVDNARRFVGFGGRLDYGTDMGNGPMRPGPRPEEIKALHEAGLANDALLGSLTRLSGDRLLVDAAVHAPLSIPNSPEDVAAWMCHARRLAVVLEEGAHT